MTLKKFATDDYRATNSVPFLINIYESLLNNVDVDNIDLSDYTKIRKYVNGCKMFEGKPQWWDITII